MLWVVSVVDSISTTSMPINEFLIYRSVHSYNMKQVLIVMDTTRPQDVIIPNDVDVYMVDNKRRKIKQIVKDIEKQHKSTGDAVIYHLHHQKSALTFIKATALMGIRKRCLFTVHSTYSGRNIKYRISSCICSLYANYANCVSKVAFYEYSSIVKKIKGDRFIAIQNGVDTDRIDEVVSMTEIDPDDHTMICVGRMIPLKNHKFLVRVLKELPNYKLILVGAEDPEGNIRNLAKECGVIDRIYFMGLIPRNEVFKTLKKARLYLSSSTVEGLPVSVLEAMRVGLIPVLSNILPHKEIADECEGT